AVLLEALEIALGEICGNVERHYPFMSFPCHDHEDFQRFAETLQPRPHAAVSKLTLIGSDASEEQLERCKRNLRRCLRRLAILQEKAPELPELLEKLPCKVQLLRAPVSRAVQQLQGRPTMIVTNVPFGIESGGKQDRDKGIPEAAESYGQFGRLLRQQRADWRGVYCLAASADDFRNHTGLEWSSELRFLNGGRWVDLLTWGGERRRPR
ncbi:unnamed protein product, partial [Effrenium voratum]